MGLANIESGLDDEQIQSLVHQLRHEYSDLHGGQDQHADRGEPDAAQAAEGWSRVRRGLETQIEAHPLLRPQRRAGMLQRIRGAESAPPPDMVYAAEQIRSRSIRSARLLEDHLAVEAARIGVPDAAALSTYDHGRAAAPGGRQPRATSEQRSRWPDLPLDPRTRHGLTALADRPDNPEGRRDLITDHPAPAVSGAEVSGVGYHLDSQRLEVLTAHQSLLVYRAVPAEVAARISQGADPDAAFREQVMGNAAHQYRDATQAAAAGVRRRCPECGQYTGASHTCLGEQGNALQQMSGSGVPGTPAAMTAVELGGQAGQLTTYPLEHIAGDLEQHRDTPVLIPVAGSTSGPTDIRGSLVAQIDAEDRVSTTGAYLWCSCEEYEPGRGCAHTTGAAGSLRTQLAQAVQDRRRVAAQQVAAAVAASAAARTDADRDSAADTSVDTSTPTAGGAVTQPAVDSLIPEAPNLSTFSYAQDAGRFADVVRQVGERDVGERVPWLDGSQSPVLYGFGADREFGVELEFDADHGQLSQPLPIDDRMNPAYRGRTYPGSVATLVGRVGQGMHEAGLTRHNQQDRYHSAVRTGYTRTVRGGWTYESDCSVAGGELVSPILSNTEEGWASVRRACEIITENGGRASASTGSHITISAQEQAGQAVRLTRFLRFMHHHQGDLHVMAAAGYDRGRSYADFLARPPQEGYGRIAQATQSIDRYSFVNVAHVAPSSQNRSGSRIEYRLWDGSIDPGRIQAQVRMSAALQDYSARDRSLEFTSERASAGLINPDASDFADRTEQVRGLLDVLFRRDQDKEQAAALWAAGLHARRFTRLDRA